MSNGEILVYNPKKGQIDWQATLKNWEAAVEKRAREEGWRASETAVTIAGLSEKLDRIRRRYYSSRRRERRT